tara:strand:+ start:283 stop:1359 length:1077 start_codon:yes stop_codon:yes gene_type:complete
MRKHATNSIQRDESGLTAVIEFLSAFTLFLMILTAFLSLAQLEMGSNDTSVDRVDRAAYNGLDRMTSNSGWYVPLSESSLDYNNSTMDWHRIDAQGLSQGIVQVGLVVDGELDHQRIAALSNITEDSLLTGLGIDNGFSMFMQIKVIESDNISRIGLALFEGGTPRNSAEISSSASVTFQEGSEKIQLILEVHDGGRKSNKLYITEISPRSVSGNPEWIEVLNPNDFAISLEGWSFAHVSPSSNTDILLKEGVISGHSTAIFTGDLLSQDTGNSSHIFDLGQSGFLGVGMVSALDDGGGIVKLSYTQLSEFQPTEVFRVEWGGDTGFFLTPGQSLEWNGNLPATTLEWSIPSQPSPGN